jgi:parallel beta-helix repeat protein
MKRKFTMFTLALLLLGLTNAQAATINVPEDQTTIQSAVDDAVTGDVIFIQNTYAHDGTLVTIDGKDLTIEGNNQSINAGFDIKGGAQVVISDLTIENIPDINGMSSQSTATSEIILNTVFDGKLTLNNVTLSHTMTTSGNYINLVGVNVRKDGELDMQNSTLNLTNESLIYGVYGQASGPIITMINNIFNAEITPNSLNNRKIYFVGHQIKADNITATISLTGNTYNVTINDPTKQTFYEVMLYAAPAALSVSAINTYIDGILTSGETAHIWYPNPIGGYYIYPGPVHNTTQGLYYSEIQPAIDEANANDMIVVAAGTYEGTILIDKAITLTGDVDNPQNVVINAPENVAKSYDNDVIQVVTDNVTIQGFTLQGAKDQAGGGQGRTNSGITLGGDYLILGSKPAGATDFTFSSWWGIGVKDIVIKNNIITDNSYGIFVFHSQNVTIEDNVIHGNTYEGATSETWSGKGIAIYTSQDMADNTLAVGNTALPATNNITIHNNEIYNNELFGIELNHSESWNGGDAGPFDVDVKITDNKIYNNGRTDNFPWGDLDYYRGITANGNEENVTVTGNEIYGHTATSGANFTAANAGIRARNTKDWTIQDNEIHGNLRGIYAYGDDTEEIEIVFNLIYDNAQGVTVSSSTTGSVNNNAIYNNDDDTWQTDGIDPFGVVNLDVAKASDLDAECNWWGTTVDTEIEAMINGDVDYRPWLKSDDLENPSCSGGLIFINGTPYTAGDAQDAIDDAVEGDVVTFLYDPGSLIIDNKEITVKYDFVKSFN